VVCDGAGDALIQIVEGTHERQALAVPRHCRDTLDGDRYAHHQLFGIAPEDMRERSRLIVPLVGFSASLAVASAGAVAAVLVNW
jgi:hypothetical protein